MVELTELELAYIAGYFDGEGCITMHKGTIHIYLCNTYPNIINYICHSFNTEVIIRYPKKDNHRVQYVLQLHSDNASTFLEKIFPYLQEKKEQAEIAISFQKLPKFHRGRTKLNVETVELRKQLVAELSALKVRSY